MAAGDSVVGICNAALLALGEMPITALTDNVRTAMMCAVRYDQVRRAALRAYPWNCAMIQAQLPAAVSTPLFRYDNAYNLPPDCLRVWNCFDAPQEEIGWVIQSGAQYGLPGTVLLTDLGPPLQLSYISDLADTTAMDALLVELIAAQLAAELCLPLSQSLPKTQMINAALAEKRASARLAASAELSPREWDEDVLLRSRI